MIYNIAVGIAGGFMVAVAIAVTTGWLDSQPSHLIAAAAARLDAIRPGWWRDIDLDRLDLNSNRNCIVGQLFGHYDQRRHRLEGIDPLVWQERPGHHDAWEAEVVKRLNIGSELARRYNRRVQP